MTEDNGGGLPPSGRFQRIEDSLLRIESKLDGKANDSDVRRIDDGLRVLALSTLTSLSDSSAFPAGRQLNAKIDSFHDGLKEIDIRSAANRMWIVRASGFLGALVVLANLFGPTLAQAFGLTK